MIGGPLAVGTPAEQFRTGNCTPSRSHALDDRIRGRGDQSRFRNQHTRIPINFALMISPTGRTPTGRAVQFPEPSTQLTFAEVDRAKYPA